MKVIFFSTKSYDRVSMDKANESLGHTFTYFETALQPATAKLVEGQDAVCIFVNDNADKETIELLHKNNVKLIVLRCAGFNNVDLKTASALGIKVMRVPAYSPYAVAEHTLAMILTLNRKTHIAYDRVRNGNFSLERLLGFDLHGRTVGVIGTGKIGAIFANIMKGLGCRVLAYDPYPNEEVKQQQILYTSLEDIYAESDIITLHCPLTQATHHLIHEESIAQMKDNVMLINTSRGGLVDTKAMIAGLKNGKIGYFGMDVYEQEENLFFQDLSGHIIQDDVIARLMTFPNVLITSHQAFFTQDAMTNIADTTLQNITDFAQGNPLNNEVLFKQ